MTLVKVCAVDELTPGEPLRVELDELDVAIVQVADEFFAIEDVCSHADFPLSDGGVKGCTIECDLHGSRFDLRSGKPLGPPATAPVPTYAVTVTDGNIYIELEN
ncbi:3-phenylpropionate/trans-cinnamate dioxygenase ferredoxin subunit [Frankineae bacterium MT45]|nr:3-phenylpropionate/trans-cinnamate dioxygenase ferredoxin subunit [Frankineae bacterium MT45]